MKINKLTAAMLLSLGVMGLGQVARAADGELLVWEDIKKSNGIEEAVKAFEAKHNVKVKILETPMPSRSRSCAWMARPVSVRMCWYCRMIRLVLPWCRG